VCVVNTVTKLLLKIINNKAYPKSRMGTGDNIRLMQHSTREMKPSKIYSSRWGVYCVQ
jgi:hypothetical protein